MRKTRRKSTSIYGFFPGLSAISSGVLIHTKSEPTCAHSKLILFDASRFILAIMDINTSLQLKSALRDIDFGQYTRATASLTTLLNAHENDPVAAYHRINIELVRAHFLRGALVAPWRR